jgi:hypothetical protein
MRQKKRTITVNETETLLSLKLNSKELRRGWCDECATEVIWIEMCAALELFAMPWLSEKSAVHLSDGRVCSRSLLSIKITES